MWWTCQTNCESGATTDSSHITGRHFTPSYNLITDVAWRVILGNYGNRKERVRDVFEARYDYQSLLDWVKQLLS